MKNMKNRLTPPFAIPYNRKLLFDMLQVTK